MAKPSMTTAAVQFLVVMAVLAAARGDKESGICKVAVDDLVQCLPAITGKSPPAPTEECCGVIRKADLGCLCKYKPELIKLGVDPANAMALPKKCGLKPPRICKK